MSAISLIPTLRRTASLSRPALAQQVFAALNARRSRRQLAALAPHLLEDIGISERAAASEAAKPVWDVPGHWLK